jgi:hypothetical protein
LGAALEQHQSGVGLERFHLRHLRPPGDTTMFYVVAGFSGYAFMHALSVGRGLTERLLTGDYRTIDLSRLGYARIETEQLYAELDIR